MYDDENIRPILKAEPKTFEEAIEMLKESMIRNHACYRELNKERKKNSFAKEHLELTEKQIDRLLSGKD